MRTLHVIMPMAGEGSRFSREGFNVPKPMILHKGKMLFQHALDSIKEIHAPRRYSFIVRQEHITSYQIDRKILEIYPEANIFSVSKTTRGSVETCLIARRVIDPEDGIIILDCDFEFESISFNKNVLEMLSSSLSDVDGGVLVSFDSDNGRYSYAEITKNNLVIRTAEKEVISKNALVGAYFFSKSEGFLYASDKLLAIEDFKKPEYYVSLLYNILLERGERVLLSKTDKFSSYGTPEELKKFD